MGVTSAVHWWWEEWQMRVLVISSLVVQFLLSYSTLLRRRALSGWFRFMMSLAFLVSDALVIYALATLFDRHKAGGGRRGGSSTLEVAWAPLLLAHLGGLHGVTAWNIEDNERWSGYLLTAVYQLALAIYVFCKSWSPGGDKKLLTAAILLFVYGGLKCLEKPWAAKRASFTILVRAQAGERRARQSEGGMGVAGYVQAARKLAVYPELLDDENDEGEAQEDRLRRERKHLHGEAYKLIFDRSSPYDHRLRNLKYFWKLDTPYGCVRQGLTRAFFHFYTRFKLMMTVGITDLERQRNCLYLVKRVFRQWTALSRVVLPWAAIGLFHQSHREAYNDIDVKVTYALLCCTAVLEYCATFGLIFSLLNEVSDREDHKTRELWPEVVTQYSLIGYMSRNKNHGKLMWIASNFGCKDMVDRRWGMNPCFSSRRITKLVLRYLSDGWKKQILDTASYHRFNDSRGHWALRSNEDLRWSIHGQLDESVLLWHIATDFCFFSSPLSEHRCASAKTPSRLSEIWSDSETEGDTRPAPETRTKCGELTACRAVQCRQMSNYMVYLLFVNPEMLLPGTRRNLFTTAYGDLKDILGDSKLNPQSCCQQVEEKELMKILMETMRDKSKKGDPKGGSQEESKEDQPINGGSKENFIDDAWHLAQGLLKLSDEEMWEVIEGVWVEMLCFSASRCRGYLHAKALGSGGEFLSYVWLLLFYMGMETFTERLQREREEHPSREGNNNAAPAPRASEDHNGSNATTSSTCRIRSRGASSPSHLHTGASTSNSEIHMADMV